MRRAASTRAATKATAKATRTALWSQPLSAGSRPERAPARKAPRTPSSGQTAGQLFSLATAPRARASSLAKRVADCSGSLFGDPWGDGGPGRRAPGPAARGLGVGGRRPVLLLRAF